MRHIITPTNVTDKIEVTGVVALYNLAGKHIRQLIINLNEYPSSLDDAAPEQRHALQDSLCNGLVIDRVIIRGRPDQTSKQAWMDTVHKGVMLRSKGIHIKSLYVEYVHIPLQIFAVNGLVGELLTLNTSGDGFQLCGNGSRLNKATINGLLEVYPYKRDHQDVGMFFAVNGNPTLHDAHAGGVVLKKSGHKWENPAPQGILAPDDSYLGCSVDGFELNGVHPEHGIRFGHAVNCTVKNGVTNGDISFGDRKTSRLGEGNQVISCQANNIVFEDGSEAVTASNHEGNIMPTNTNDRAQFFDYLRSVFGALTQDQVRGIEHILEYWDSHYPTANPAWVAYSLATAWHETATRMQPIKEFGGDEWAHKMYDINGSRPKVAKVLGNTEAGDGVKYAGRGLPMLTGRWNYNFQGQKHGIDLVGQPDLMLNPDVAVKVMIEGMMDGDFSKLKQAGRAVPASFDAFTGDDGTFNALAARRIINGSDKQYLIKGHHDGFLAALTASDVPEDALAADLIANDWVSPVVDDDDEHQRVAASLGINVDDLKAILSQKDHVNLADGESPVIVPKNERPPVAQQPVKKEEVTMSTMTQNTQPLVGKKTYITSLITAAIGIAGFMGYVPGLTPGDSIQLIQNAGLASTFRAAFSQYAG